MLDAVGDDLDGQFFRVADGFFPSCAVTHDSGQLHGFGNPAAIFLAVEFNGKNHSPSIHQLAPWVSAARTRMDLRLRAAEKIIPIDVFGGIIVRKTLQHDLDLRPVLL